MRKTLLTIAIVGAAAVAAALALDRPAVEAAASQPGPSAEARYAEAAQDTIRRRLRAGPELAFRDVAVYRFGPADERAVCGSVRLAGAAEAGFVVRILLPRDQGQALSGATPRYQTVMEQGPGLVNADAQAMDRYCREAGATIAAPVPALVPAPVPAPLLSQPMAAVPAAPVLAATAETAVIRSPARLRTAPGGEVVRIAAQGEALAIFGRAPGGWLQVGTAEPQGWVHASMTSQAP
ncbi:MAG: hypothetical protein JWP04_4003 [Belnapia sp.]|nr:hypothetical protein [Belnapia sp.]